MISGRSDSTLNRLGVRIGSADIYAAVEGLGDVLDALVVGAELGADYYMPFFVVLAEGADLDAARTRIESTILTALSPRHVPDEIIAAPGTPAPGPARSSRCPSSGSHTSG